jgi:RHS repeat-associated protein
MVEQNRSGSYTQIVYAPGGSKLALMNGQTLSKAFVPLPASDTAVYTSGPALSYYRHADWLGSSRFASTSSRTMYFDTAYAPYGEPYAGSGTTDLSFTGQNADTVGDEYDFLNREYHYLQGRWISPDPAGLTAADPTNPQGWNRYAYVLNSPTTLIDPLGLDYGGDPPCVADPSTGHVYCGPGGSGGGPGGGPCSQIVMAFGFAHPENQGCGGTGSGGGTGRGVGSPPTPVPQTGTAQQAAAQYCQASGQLAFNIPFTNIPVTISASATAGVVNYSWTNDWSIIIPTLPAPSFGASIDVTVNAPTQPSPSVNVGAGKNASVGTFLTRSGPQGLTLSVGPSVGPPVTISAPMGNTCGQLAPAGGK